MGFQQYIAFTILVSCILSMRPSQLSLCAQMKFIMCNTISIDKFASTTPVRISVINLFFIIFYFFYLFFPLIFCENISFDASLVMYINSTNIPPIMIINRMYKNQKFLYIVPLIKHTTCC
jgi:hypothetical protein